MEYSEFVLIAFVLLIVFFGFQVSKLKALLGQRKNDTQSSVKTVISASEPAVAPKPVKVPRKKTTAKKPVKTSRKGATSKTVKAPVKKPVKKAVAKKKTTKK
ncbi:MAG: hypothetical protein J6P93_01345 [Alphaproteobacteria bacterium]|nr:hypothetical protein [Alphaproteobacteria bacterium]